jgi:hypothetical protein
MGSGEDMEGMIVVCLKVLFLLVKREIGEINDRPLSRDGRTDI